MLAADQAQEARVEVFNLGPAKCRIFQAIQEMRGQVLLDLGAARPAASAIAAPASSPPP
jgi:hypothetical protein